MPSFLNGDYSKYPEVIRETFPYIAGETCQLRQAWAVYHRLFMDDQRLTAIMGERLGRLLGLLQTTNQDAMLLSISRLTDKDSRSQPNLSVWCLEQAVPFAKSPEFQNRVRQSLDSIWSVADNIRKHRHKRIAHFDRNVSLKKEPLPKVPVAEIRALIEMIEGYLNKLAERRGEVTAEVTTAQPLSETQQNTLGEQLRRAVGRRVTVALKVDPDLLGGMIVKVGSRMIDGSLKSRLHRLQLAMKGVG